jgi:mono/diheme cytochrome c family protein
MKKILIALTVLVGSCVFLSFKATSGIVYKELSNGIACDTSIVYYDQQIAPLLQANCVVCHNPNEPAKKSHGVYLDTYDHVKATIEVKVKNGVTINELEKVIVNKRMPPRDHQPLTDAQKKLIVKWVQQGMQHTSCEETTNSVNSDLGSSTPTYEGQIKPLLQNRCLGCHNGPKAPDGLDFTNTFTLMEQISNGRFVKAIQHAEGVKPMPSPTEKLSDAEIALVQLWISSGLH